jgi:Ni/Co efflux regulator RcnB
MHTKSIVCALAALSVGFSGLTFAQQDKDVRADQAAREQQRGTEQPRDHGRAQQPQRAAERARGEDGRRDEPQQRGEHRSDSNWREGGDRHHFNRGDRLPSEYRSRQYVVDDWRDHRLSAPPRGYHWVQADGDFLLVAITTGIIASILLNQ